MAAQKEPTAIEMLVAGGPVFFDLCEAKSHKELLHKVNTAIRLSRKSVVQLYRTAGRP